MQIDILPVIQILISLGGLGVAVRVAMTLQKLATTLEFAVADIKDHEERIRKIESRHD